MKPEAPEKVGAWTEDHTNEYLGVVLKGEVRSVAYIESQYDQGAINGRITKQAAEDLGTNTAVRRTTRAGEGS